MAYEERYDRSDREDRDERPARRGKEKPDKRRQQKPVTYKYRLQNSPKRPQVHGVQHPKLGEIISTKDGSCKVLEVFWRTATDADVLLRLIETEKLTTPEKLAVKDAAKKSVTKPVPKKQGSQIPKGKKS
jgi:hypothetical protein